MKIESKVEKTFNVINIVILSLLGVVFLVPYLMIFSSAFTSESAFLKYGYSVFPHGFTFQNFIRLFSDGNTIIQALGNTLFYTVAGTLLCVTTTFMAAYPLSKWQLPGRKFIMGFLLVAMLFSGGLVPTYLLIVKYLHLKNNWLSLLLPGMLGPFTVMTMLPFLQGIPASLEESIKMDGGNNVTVLLHVYIPMSLPLVASTTMSSAIGFWNAWSGPLLYFDQRHSYMFPLMTVIQQMFQENVDPNGGYHSGYTETVKMASIVVTTLPIIAAYPLMHKYFIKGMMLGAVKE